MIIFYDPKSNNQIRAVFSGDTTSKVWESLGYIKAEVPKEMKPSQDKAAVLEDGKVVELISYPRPILSVNKRFIVDDGIDEIIVKPGFLGDKKDQYKWVVRKMDINTGAKSSLGKEIEMEILTFSSEVPGHYEIKCVSESFGTRTVVVEVKDA